MGFLRRLSDLVNMAATFICVAFLLFMLSISFTGAFYQAVTGDALAWTYSLARQFVPWIGLLSITVAFRNGEHVAMAMIVNRLPTPLRRGVEWLILAAFGIFAVVMLYEGIHFTAGSDQLVMISDHIQISQRWVAASVPVTGAVLLIHLVCGRNLLEGPVVHSDTTEGLVPELDHIRSGEH